MPNQPPDTTLPASWDSFEVDSEQAGLLPGAKIGRFHIVELLGHGGMGAVYLARDEGGAQVALKTLHRIGVPARERLKREFRSLAQVRHPSLVQLYELYGVGDETFFTMEYVQGRALTADVDTFQRGSPLWEERIRLIWKQLVHGLDALHTRDLLHLDLKPDNILVTPDGQVKILDFGLTQSIRSQHKSAPGRRSGTPRYMAPEILAGEAPMASADFYALGVILRQLLTGDSLDEPSGNVSARQPADLWEISGRLMLDSPAERPGVEDLLSSTGEGGRRLAARRAAPAVFVGRAQELDILRNALATARSGQPQWVEVLGESGVGKSALVRRLRAEADKDPSVVILSGACHERESTPFQGLDGVMEDLAALVHAAGPSVEMKEQMSRAAEIFPAFCPKTDSDSAPPSESDPLLRRRRAFGAIRRLFKGITESKTALLFIDDLQWADPDGARLLAELLSSPTPEHVCLITTRRAGSSNGFVEEVHESLEIRGSEVCRDEIKVGRLSDDLSLECLRGYGDVDPEQAETILRVAGGLPFLVEALGRRSWDKDTPPTLEGLIDSWLVEFPPGARDVLLAVALSPVPLPQAVALEQAENPARTAEILASLRLASLVRSEGESPDGPLEPYHALIGEAVQTHVDRTRKKGVRIRLARSLEAKKLAGPEHLATIYHLAEELGEAGRYAPLAAAEAEAALAFETAADWYKRAIEWTGEERIEWLVSRARCLKNAGHEASAAECFERAAELDKERQGELLRFAGIAWLAAGHIDRGLAVLEPQLLAMKLRVPKSSRAAAVTLFPLLFGMWRRGLRFEPRLEHQCDARELSAADASWECAKPSTVIMPMQGLVMHLNSLKVALSAGEPKRIARSLALLGAAAVGSPIDMRASELTRRAEEIASEYPDDYVRGSLLTFRALQALARGESPIKVRDTALDGLALLRRCPEPSAWEEQTALGLSLIASSHLADIELIHSRAAEWLAESSDRRDLFAQILASQGLISSLIAKGNIEEARRYVRWPLERWSQKGFTVQHFYGVVFEAHCDIYEGDWERAREGFLAQYDNMRGAQLLRIPISRREIRTFHSLLELGALRRRTSSSRRSEKAVRVNAQDLTASGTKIGLGQALMLEAGLLAHHGQNEQAIHRAKEAISIFEACDYRMLAHCLAMRVAQAEGDQGTVFAMLRRLRSLGIADPDKVADCYVPRLLPA